MGNSHIRFRDKGIGFRGLNSLRRLYRGSCRGVIIRVIQVDTRSMDHSSNVAIMLGNVHIGFRDNVLGFRCLNSLKGVI